MDHKRLILAVAGSGKTTYLINQLNENERFFIITYTINNAALIRDRIIKKFNYLPNNIKVFTYFDFLYNFCTKPFVFSKYHPKGIDLENSPEFTRNFANTNINRYFSKSRHFYHNRLSKFLEFEKLHDDICSRLEKFCDHLFFDECQDLGGHDFNFIMTITKAKINFLFVGDFYQNTYVTSFDGPLNSGLYDDYPKFVKRFEDKGITIDTSTLNNSHRCSATICDFITKNLGIEISSHNNLQTLIVHIEDKDKIARILNDDKIIKLAYDGSHLLPFRAKNWGECKGEDDYHDTCILLNKTTYNLFRKQNLIKTAPRTKKKLYVALSRTRGNCYLIDQNQLANIQLR
jgi:hypothetical protein